MFKGHCFPKAIILQAVNFKFTPLAERQSRKQFSPPQILYYKKITHNIEVVSIYSCDSRSSQKKTRFKLGTG